MRRLRFLTGNVRPLLVIAFGLAALAWTWRTEAQLINGNQWPHPRLNVLTPCGGKAGTTVEVAFAGTDMEQPESLWFSHPGIKGTPIIPPTPPPDPKIKDPAKQPMAPPVSKFSVVIDKGVPPGFYDVRFVNKHGISNPRVFVVGDLNEVAEKEPNNDVEQAQRVEIGTTISGVINPATDVDYAVFAGKKGQRVLITCLAASIDSRMSPEVTVRGPLPRVPLGVTVEPVAEKDKVKGVRVTAVATGPATQAGVKVGDIVTKLNGKDMTDPKVFAQETAGFLSGEKVNLVVSRGGKDEALTASIDETFGHGREIGASRPPLGRDAVIDVTLPADGDYLVRTVQFTYTAGGPEFYYRLNITAAPWIESVFPPMIEPGKAAKVTLHGFNLPGGQPDPTAVIGDRPMEKLVVDVTAPNEPGKLRFSGLIPPAMAAIDGFEYRLGSGAGASNPRLLSYARYPVVIENDDNDTPEKAQAIPTPCEVAGRIDKKRDRDWYVFTAKKGEVVMIELQSDRLGAPTDMYFKLMNLGGKAPVEITFQDDTPDALGLHLFTASSDPPPFRFVAPEDGKYHLLVGSHLADNQADPRHVYRLRVGPEKPDFRIIAMPPDDHRPEACVLGQGGHETYAVYVQRFDGFKGDIALTVEGLPPGVTCPPQVLSGNMKLTHLTLAAADNAPPFTGTVKVIGTAVIAGQKVVHEARPATITWAIPIQQNIRTVTRLDQSLILAVRDKVPGKLTATPDKFAVSVGDKVNIPLKLARNSAEFKGQFQITPVPPELPVGMTFAAINMTPGKDDQPLVLTVGPNTPPGTYNLVFRGFAPISKEPKGKPLNTILPSNAVQVVVLPKQVANLTVDNPNLTAKPGADVVATVKVQRLFDYADAFKVDLTLPPNTKGVTVENITIAPGANEAKLTIKIAKDAPPMNLQNLNLRAVAVVNGNVTLTHEIKINLNIVK
jgi:hypothetical protein